MSHAENGLSLAPGEPRLRFVDVWDGTEPLENAKGHKKGLFPKKLRKKYGILLKKLGVWRFLSIFAP